MHDEIDDRADLKAELRAQMRKTWPDYQDRLEKKQAEPEEPELHSCGYPDNSFACKIRHQYIQHGWAKGDH